MEFKQLTSLDDFKKLQKGDNVLCKFQRDVGNDKRKRRFGHFEIIDNKEHDTEIILEQKDNIYFNYKMFLDGQSNLIEIYLIVF